jgi:hypothetical protein
VSKALKTGHLVAGEDGRIDPDHSGNSFWISWHQGGIDGPDNTLSVDGADSFRDGVARQRDDEHANRPEASGETTSASWFYILGGDCRRLIGRRVHVKPEPNAWLVQTLIWSSSLRACSGL